MKLEHWIGGSVVAGAGLLLYGALVEADRLRVEQRVLPIPGWPTRLEGFRIALLADLHLRESHSVRLAERAVAAALDAQPDMVVMAGDYVGRWKADSEEMLRHVLEPLLLMQGDVVAVPGNRDYLQGNASLLLPVFEDFGIRLLRNESWNHLGVTWLGIDSANARRADPFGAMLTVEGRLPIVAVWHEPDMVDWLPEGPLLMLSGHSHGGQFLTPWGWAPMTSSEGRRYIRGFYPKAPTPIYVSRGVGTTGPPSRLFCPPEVSILTLVRA